MSLPASFLVCKCQKLGGGGGGVRVRVRVRVREGWEQVLGLLDPTRECCCKR